MQSIAPYACLADNYRFILRCRPSPKPLFDRKLWRRADALICRRCLIAGFDQRPCNICCGCGIKFPQIRMNTSHLPQR